MASSRDDVAKHQPHSRSVYDPSYFKRVSELLGQLRKAGLVIQIVDGGTLSVGPPQASSKENALSMLGSMSNEQYAVASSVAPALGRFLSESTEVHVYNQYGFDIELGADELDGIVFRLYDRRPSELTVWQVFRGRSTMSLKPDLFDNLYDTKRVDIRYQDSGEGVFSERLA